MDSPSAPLDRLGDAELARLCLERHPAAWEELVDRYADLVYGIARRSGLDGSAGEDVVQEVLLLLVRNLHRLRDRDRLAGWIVKTARREAWRAARRRRAAQAREEGACRPEREIAPLPDDVLAEEERCHLVRRALGTLDDRCRRLLDALFLRGDADYRGLAEDLQMPVGSIGPTRRRCLEKLIPALEAVGLAPPDVSGPKGSVSGGVGLRGPTKGAP